MNPRAFKLFALLLLSAILGAPVALAQAAPKAVTKAPGTAGNNRITEDLTFGTGRTILGEAGSTFNWLGVLQGTPTGGTLNLSNLTLTLPGTYLTTAQVNGYFADPSTNGSFSAATWRADLGLVIGTNVQAYDAALAALSAGSDFVQFTGPASTIKTFTLPNSSATILTDAAIVTGAQGGTGVANTGKTITLGGNLTTSGAFPLTLTIGASTNVTLPASGTLATLAGTETLTNKKLGSLTTNGFVKTSAGDGTLSVDTTNYTSQDATFLGKTGNVGMDSATNTAALWSALPVGYARLMSSTIGTAGGLPSASNFYFHKLANRDVSGGWAGLALRLDTTGGWFVGLQTDSATLPVWDRLWGATYLNALVPSGIVKSTAGVPSAAVAGTDYLAPNPNIGTATGTSLALTGTNLSVTAPVNTGVTMNATASGTGTPVLNVTGDAGTSRLIQLNSGGTGNTNRRWQILATATAEAGSNAGSNFNINAMDDTGTIIDTPFSIPRAGGSVNFTRAIGVQPASGVTANITSLATGAADAQVTINRPAGQTGRLYFQSGGSNRWSLFANNVAEGGASAGSNLDLIAYDDTGTSLGVALSIARASGGTINLARPVSHTNTTDATSTTTGGSTFSGGVGIAKALYTGNGITNAPASGTSSAIRSTATGAADSIFILDRASGQYGKLSYRTANSSRWEWRASSLSETGSNAGSDYEVIAFADDGATSLGTVLSITRAAGGNFTVSRPISGTDTTDSTSTATGALKTSGGLGVAKTIYAGTGVLSTGTGGVGYATGAGGAVTQITSRSTGVTLNKTTGAITLFTAAGSATATSFTVTNSTVAATDVIVLSVKSASNKYLAFVTAVAAGSFEITFYTTGGTTSDAPVINFAVIKAVAA